jgi:hypothetical protein
VILIALLLVATPAGVFEMASSSWGRAIDLAASPWRHAGSTANGAEGSVFDRAADSLTPGAETPSGVRKMAMETPAGSVPGPRYSPGVLRSLRTIRGLRRLFKYASLLREKARGLKARRHDRATNGGWPRSGGGWGQGSGHATQLPVEASDARASAWNQARVLGE